MPSNRRRIRQHRKIADSGKESSHQRGSKLEGSFVPIQKFGDLSKLALPTNQPSLISVKEEIKNNKDVFSRYTLAP